MNNPCKEIPLNSWQPCQLRPTYHKIEFGDWGYLLFYDGWGYILKGKFNQKILDTIIQYNESFVAMFKLTAKNIEVAKMLMWISGELS